MRPIRTARLLGLALCALGALWSGCAASGEPGSPETARSALAGALQARYPEITRFELAPLSGEARRQSAAAPSVSGFEIPADVALEKRIRIWAITAGKDGANRRAPWWWAVKAFGPAMVARRGLRAGEQIHPTDIAVEERDLTESPGLLLTADPGVGGARWRVTRFIRAGAALRRSDLEPAPQVARGQEIRVSVVSDVYTIETTGIARDEGRVGDVIAVTRPGTSERYFAEVTGEREALIRGKP
ncbi:MAG TPA: flagellar basal body P-ring formation chaperone FlgA [Burkholderiales bacterium]|nr:flagellar basal body P-ring formation chaperone FlgA [Burkholderiales bacterium]